MEFTTVLLLLCVGLIAGILSGLIGVGGGIIIVPLLVLFGFTQHQAQGTSLAALLPPVTLLAVINYHKAGHINWKYAMIISIIFIIGGYLGSKIAISIDQKVMKKIFGIILLLVAGKLLLEK
ncbi:MAG: sulfite exporter TauE/SafE family protein [Flavobacterium sp.]